MSGLRITQRSLNVSVISNLQANLSNMQRLQEQLSSGKQLSKPSDSPQGTVSSLLFRSSLSRADQMTRNADDGGGWLSTADTTLTSGLDLINRARSLAAQGINGSMTTADRAALAAEIDQLRSQALDLANTTYLDRPVFAGTAPGLRAYDPTTGLYVGDTGAVTRSVAPNVSVQVNVTGPQAFGTTVANGGTGDLFEVLASLSANLNSSNLAGIAADQANLDSVFVNMSNTLSTVGAKTNQIETMKAKVEAQKVDTQNSLSIVEDIDLPATIVKLQLQQTAYQAALSATTKVIQPSLVDFLR